MIFFLFWLLDIEHAQSSTLDIVSCKRMLFICLHTFNSVLLKPMNGLGRARSQQYSYLFRVICTSFLFAVCISMGCWNWVYCHINHNISKQKTISTRLSWLSDRLLLIHSIHLPLTLTHSPTHRYIFTTQLYTYSICFNRVARYHSIYKWSRATQHNSRPVHRPT